MKQAIRRTTTHALCVLLLVGCAARGPRAKTQTASLTVGELVLALDAAEYRTFAAGLYDEPTHRRIGDGILRVLYAARAFERAAAAWPADATLAPQMVRDALSQLETVLTDLERAVPTGAARQAIRAAIAAIRAATVGTGG